MVTSADASPAPTLPPKPYLLITAACLGNALEWYDISVYSYFATYIGKNFFPSHDQTTSLLLTLGTFAVSFLIRPIGAFFLGAYADRAGRKPALSLSIILMVIGTLMLCIMPPYASIGLLAPIGILVGRLIQGFSAGGEYGSSTALMIEHVPHRRNFSASWQFASQAISALLASVLGTILSTTLTTSELTSWGFRLPFVVGLLVGPIGWYLRRKLPEVPEFERAAEENASNRAGREILQRGKARVLLVIGVLAVTTCVNYMITYMPTYAVSSLGLPASTGFIAAVVAGIVVFVICPLAGHYSDRVGRMRIMLPATILILVLICPIFLLLVSAPGLVVMLATLFVMAALKASYSGPMGALIGDIFVIRTRATGMALGYNIGVALFGGVTPLLATWLIKTTGTPIAPSFWVIVAGLVSLVSLVVLYRNYNLR